MTVTEVLTLLPESKDQVESFATILNSCIDNGEISALRVALIKKAFDEVFDRLPSLKELALAEAEKYGEKKFSYHGAKIEIRELGVKFDFANCGDIIHSRLSEKLHEAETASKERESMLKTLTGSIILTDEDSGEMYTVYPPTRKSTTGIAISFK